MLQNPDSTTPDERNASTVPRRRIDYKAVELRSPGRITLGRGKQGSIEAGGGVRLLRVTEDERDDLHVSGPNIPPGTEIPWSNVASAVPAARSGEA